MEAYFRAAPLDPFVPYSKQHVIILLIIGVGIYCLYQYQDLLRQEQWNVMIRYTIAFLFIGSEIGLDVWQIKAGIFQLSTSLPFELCTISLLLATIMIVTKSYKLYEIVFFTGIIGASQAILTPNLQYAFPHFRFIEFFIAHVLLIWAPLFMTWVEGYRPTFQSIKRTMLFLNILVPIVSFVNYKTGGNYMFLAHKPETASLLDLLGPHPYYIISLEIIAFIGCLLLYIPFSGNENRMHKESLGS
ncbi:TIGR02206 family membrane protein [Bacillus pseudomycoides]|uniref:TIGR02206 family membrane protein n=1 Tax=Bacillus pseudomycoides TaxID=64104 RepID=A0AA91ZSD1_9BACI|nr:MULTISPECIES: TIGR02206 family membrane protein [Bacillus]PEB56524.1 TIGR02206 family membrane protein [Bacillus sp. AFS098217]PED81536.1 TIGR02206 family membrane protein [Bacillus pseudomycoides]PEU07738.1 TIGR02206 family membrane protein [Bacillus sp. AFS019443]PEU10791.1 TIGR02206 family membrane protein [Bacillus sp. AFS014408]PFW62821.1 TIGR02206 family membrane protein [Bacillus sp. AFS075034]